MEVKVKNTLKTKSVDDGIMPFFRGKFSTYFNNDVKDKIS